MKKIFLFFAVIIPNILFAQSLKVISIDKVTIDNSDIDFRKDLNGNNCALVELTLSNPNVAFEGNIIGGISHEKDSYKIFLSPNSKFLNVKYPGQDPLLIKFSDYNISSLPSFSFFIIRMEEPSANFAENIDSGLNTVSDEAESYYETGRNLLSGMNLEDAFNFFTRSYELGHPKAAFYLGWIYNDPYYEARKVPFASKKANIPDLPVKRSPEMAYKYYLESAELGYVQGQFYTGECLEKGKGVKKDKELAMEWYKKAADQGHLQAMDKLGIKVKKKRTFGMVTGYGSDENEFIISRIGCDPMDLSAVSDGRLDQNGNYCALLKILMPFENVNFNGNIVGDPVFKTNEYWVYVPQATNELEITYPGYEPLKINFKKAGVNNLIGKNTYVLHISFPIDLVHNFDNLNGEDCYKIGMGYIDRLDQQYSRWLSKASEKDYGPAQVQYGIFNVSLAPVNQGDLNLGLKLLESASNKGMGEASYHLGKYYERKKDKENAQLWFDKAKSQGFDFK